MKKPAKRNTTIKDENGVWCRTDKTKSEAFASHLYKTFQPHNINNGSDTEDINNFLDSPCPTDWPIKHISPQKVQEEIDNLNCKKSPRYDSIDEKVVQALSKKLFYY